MPNASFHLLLITRCIILASTNRQRMVIPGALQKSMKTEITLVNRDIGDIVQILAQFQVEVIMYHSMDMTFYAINLAMKILFILM